MTEEPTKNEKKEKIKRKIWKCTKLVIPENLIIPREYEALLSDLDMIFFFNSTIN